MRKGLVIGLTAGLMLALLGTAAADHIFPDVPDDHTHASGIHWAAEHGLVEGFDDGTFRPGRAVTRAQLATILENQGAYRGPAVTITPLCGTTEMMVIDHNLVGSGAATVEYSVDGGDRTQLLEPIPDDGEALVFDAAAPGIVSIFVDSIAWGHAPTAEDCEEPAEE